MNFSRFRSFSVDSCANILDAEEDREKKDCFRPSGRPLEAGGLTIWMVSAEDSDEEF